MQNLLNCIQGLRFGRTGGLVQAAVVANSNLQNCVRLKVLMSVEEKRIPMRLDFDCGLIFFPLRLDLLRGRLEIVHDFAPFRVAEEW